MKISTTRIFQQHSAKYTSSLCIGFLPCRACKYCRPRSLCICFLSCRACKYRRPRSLCIVVFPCRECTNRLSVRYGRRFCFCFEGCCLLQEFATVALAQTTAQQANQRLLQLHVGGGLRAPLPSCEAWRGPGTKCRRDAREYDRLIWAHAAHLNVLLCAGSNAASSCSRWWPPRLNFGTLLWF